MKYTNDNGLLVDNSTSPPTCAGYIFNFGHCAYAPGESLGELSQAEIDTHNRLLGQAEFEAMKKNGRGLLYLSRDEQGQHTVATWSGHGRTHVWRSRQSWHNMAGKNGRTDVWFNLDGSTWHGVNIGDNQICRVKRCKS